MLKHFWGHYKWPPAVINCPQLQWIHLLVKDKNMYWKSGYMRCCFQKVKYREWKRSHQLLHYFPLFTILHLSRVKVKWKMLECCTFEYHHFKRLCLRLVWTKKRKILKKKNVESAEKVITHWLWTRLKKRKKKDMSKRLLQSFST